MQVTGDGFTKPNIEGEVTLYPPYLSLKIDLRRFQQFVLLIGIASTPLYNVMEVLALVQGTLAGATVAITPSYVKGAKDAIYAAVTAAGIVAILARLRVLDSVPFWGFFLFWSLSAVASAAVGRDAIILYAGVRWIWPILLVCFLYRVIDEDFQIRVAMVLKWLFILAFLLQAYQFVSPQYWYGVNIFGLTSRNPGFYLTPSSLAFFDLLTLFYLRHFLDRTPTNRYIARFAIPISVVLTGSGTGIVALIAVLLVRPFLRSRYKPLWLLLIPLLILAGVFAVSIVSGRADILTSAATRIEIFIRTVTSADTVLLSTKFGTATNVGVLLVGGDEFEELEKGVFVADSGITSLAGNVGLVGTIAFLMWFLRTFSFKQIETFELAVLFGSFLITTVAFEVFPCNLLMAINLAYYMRSRALRCAPRRHILASAPARN